jgi:hypothetical protein
MATHRFNHPNDLTKGGTWFGAYGKRVCDWSWDAATKTVTVTRGPRGSSIDLSNSGLLTPEDLRVRLPDLALKAAQRLKKR